MWIKGLLVVALLLTLAACFNVPSKKVSLLALAVLCLVLIEFLSRDLLHLPGA